MRFPSIRERVRLEGHEGVFLVVGLDRPHGLADVISTARGGRVMEVPLVSIKPLVDEHPVRPDGESKTD